MEEARERGERERREREARERGERERREREARERGSLAHKAGEPCHLKHLSKSLGASFFERLRLSLSLSLSRSRSLEAPPSHRTNRKTENRRKAQGVVVIKE